MALNNQGRGKPSTGNNNRGRHQRPVDPYSVPDVGGVVILSTNPRPVTLALDPRDAMAVVAALRASEAPAALVEYVESKLAWTRSRNDKNANIARKHVETVKNRGPRVPKSSPAMTPASREFAPPAAKAARKASSGK